MERAEVETGTKPRGEKRDPLEPLGTLPEIEPREEGDVDLDSSDTHDTIPAPPWLDEIDGSDGA
jgi:hypothetical protein